MHINREIRQQLVDIIVPHVQTATERQSLLSAAFIGTTLPDLINVDGSPRDFASSLIIESLRYGSIEGKPAIVYLLEEIKQWVGPDRATEIDDLINSLQAQPEPTRDTSSPNNRVFVSYRRANSTFIARAVFQELRAAGFDVFLDAQGIDSGNFEKIILKQIESRPHFVVILSPGSLDRCVNPDDWLRREIRHALDTQRNIVPILFNGFTFEDHTRLLEQAGLSDLARQQALRVPAEPEFFEAAMQKLRSGYLKLNRRVTVSAASDADETIVRQKINLAAGEAEPTAVELQREAAQQRSEKAAADKPWYTNPNVLAGLFVLAAAVITGIFVLWQGVFVGGDTEPTEVIVAASATMPEQTATDPPTVDSVAVATEVPLDFADMIATTQAFDRAVEAQGTADAEATLARESTALALTNAPTQTAVFFATLYAVGTATRNAQLAQTPSATPLLPTATPTPTRTTTPLPPTNTPDPVTLARTPVTRNADWTPIERDFDGVTMVLVPAGCFMMGSNEQGDEQPVHEQCFDEPFWIDKYEVTNAQIGSTGCSDWSSEPDQPRNCIDWFGAQAHCESWGAHLPTEREWEYAARGPDSWVYPWGNAFVADNAVYSSNSGGRTAPVGSRPGGVSWVGAYDMSGNVWEWVSSLYRDYEYDASDGREDMTNRTDRRVLRGGSWSSEHGSLRSALRLWINPV
ncbi:MAG: SUMF1/EgtB/PvdO family nonheme iron enzyme, partial [Chloroflexota bacterium]